MPKLGIAPLLRQKRIMGPLLDHFTLFQHDDCIRIGDGAEAVGNGDHGPALARLMQRLLNLTLGLAVQRAGGFVQQKDRRVFEQRARNAHTLFFTTRRLQSPLAHRCLVTVGQRRDKVVDLRGFGYNVGLPQNAHNFVLCDYEQHQYE